MEETRAKVRSFTAPVFTVSGFLLSAALVVTGVLTKDRAPTGLSLAAVGASVIGAVCIIAAMGFALLCIQVPVPGSIATPSRHLDTTEQCLRREQRLARRSGRALIAGMLSLVAAVVLACADGLRSLTARDRADAPPHAPARTAHVVGSPR